ncbi:hypothetical protein [Streptomyces sp. NPDC048659]|uniref:hypothetical protein n=1 Tax=Streptomyces sp. NPDC048659 TaxID=3155489 RepID=UPI0034133F49
MPFEAELSRALDRTTDSLDPDLTALMDGAVARGRSRRRRRTAVFVAGTGAFAAVTAAALTLPGALAGARAADSDLAMVALAMPRSAISGDQMVRALEATFPGGRFSEVTRQSNDPSNPSAGLVANAGFVYDDGHGPAAVGVSAVRLKLPLRDGAGLDCESKPVPEGDSCALKELPSSAALPGGALLMTEESVAERPAGPRTAHRWTMTLTLKSTGAQLQLTQWNSPGGGTGSTMPEKTRPAPPLTEEQAVAALTGPTWAPILGAVG